MQAVAYSPLRIVAAPASVPLALLPWLLFSKYSHSAELVAAEIVGDILSLH